MLSGFHTSVTLKNACEAALKDQNYDSEGTRQTMSQKLKDDFSRRSPYDWQLDVAETLILGLDCVVVTETGAGKTIRSRRSPRASTFPTTHHMSQKQASGT